MHFHFILDEIQYNDLLSPMIAEARRRRHLVTTSLRCATRYDADAYVGLQDVALLGCPRPRVFMTHGLGLAKRGHLTLDVDLLLLPYGRDTGIIDDQAAAPGNRMTTVHGLGSPKIDLLARRRQSAPALRRRLREIYGFDARPIIGYCPTWRHDGTLHHAQRAHRLREAEALLERDFNVVVLPHALEHDKSEVEELHFQPSAALSRLDHLVALDCAVTDTSGIGFELCAIGMPMVLLDNPAEPDYLLARMLERPVPIDYGPVCTLETLSAAVASALAHPEAHAARRDYWAQMAFGPRDGRAAERVIDAITEFAISQRPRFIPAAGAPMPLQDYRAARHRFRSARPWMVRGGVPCLPLEDRAGSVFYGPYQPLGAGRFALEVDLEASGTAPLELQVDTEGGRRVLARMPVQGRVRASLPFTVPPALAGNSFEFRLRQPAPAEGEVLMHAFRLLQVALPEPEMTLPPENRPPPAEVVKIVEVEVKVEVPVAPPRPEPLPDPAWAEVAGFLEAQVAPASRVLAPEAFRPWLPEQARMDSYGHAPPPGEGPGREGDYDWVVLHKGWLDSLSLPLLLQLKEAARPVMANAVFIVWRATELPDRHQSAHVQAFLERLRVMDMQSFFAKLAARPDAEGGGPEASPEGAEPLRE
ncbi:CDP-glycerol glycerophosphotransferase family protein [Roseomonas marmotae]|uniref:CDP-glycerol glycerophosphotransferase family protein n=1 Tax=Roseomonas marmotae TaxID=2768161 RepID=A0ABS3KGK0_9PROT|nr:CDP-glycerol glycerophosphotransferase family protein [Roseomonas marmotae]MBO1076597.1 CDP-glycerol glycerophosphotransferase family protein [Roseomonas marmotae]QTI79581.1 CDP-glycerol glycerophosphotransferase family protein [Roseomonas marmotae]